MVIPKKVEEKIRYLCRKFPTLEWSGVLFTSYKGKFEDGSLTITCEDIYPMDLGSSGFTQFKMDETVAGYMAENIELFDCDINLLHSHNQMNCWFSGTDISTLREEGAEKNCFVSLIVNNAGDYCAAITRKLQTKNEVTVKSLGTSYEFFGEGSIDLAKDSTPETTQVVEKEIIQYFMLDIEKEEAPNHLAWLDTRFEEIEAKKKSVSVPSYKRVYEPKNRDTVLQPKDFDWDNTEDFYSWYHSERKESAEAKEQLLFDKEDMEKLKDVDAWQPDPTIIHYLCCQLLTCSLIVNKDIDLKQWVTKHMVKKYDEIFSGVVGQFNSWSDMYVEFILEQYSDENTPVEMYDEWDVYQGRIAEALIDEIGEYPHNEYITRYVEVLTNYVMM